MPLPPLLKHVYNHGTEEVIRRGKRIYNTGGASLLDHDPLTEQARFRVRNDQYNNVYTVTVNKYGTPAELTIRCQCPYNLGEICRHEVAALFQLNDLAQSGFFQNAETVYDQKHTVLRLRTVSANVFTDPELATVGISQDEVDAGKTPARQVMLPLTGNARAKMAGVRDGFVKLFCRPATGQIIGGVVVAPKASELILPITMAVENNLTVDQLAHTITIYPSLSGSIAEAARQLMQHELQ